MTPANGEMAAVVLDEFGGINKLKTRKKQIPTVGPDEILIHVETAGVGVWDPFEREGGFAKEYGTKAKFPYVLGADGAGTVEAVGERVNRFKAGDRAYAMSIASPKGGFYAEYTVVKEKNAAPVPGQLSIEEAGGMPVDAITALCGLDKTLHLKNGETLMIVGASGGIGHLAIQLAQRMGARVFAVASGKDGVELAKKLGAEAAVDGHKGNILKAARDFAPDGIDAALVTAGGKNTNEALKALKDGGRVAYPNGVEPTPKAPKNVTAKSYDGNSDPALLEKLNELINAGPFEVHIARTFALADAAKAQKALQEHYVGKIILRPN